MGGGDAKNVDVKSFGSFAAGLYLPTADMDLVAVSRTFMSYGQKTFCQSFNQMRKLMMHLIRVGIAQDGTHTVVAHARVPIVKFIDRKTGIKVDISFENDSGLRANRTFQEWKLRYPTMPVVVVMIKQMLAMRDLNEVFTGGLGGFSIICLVVSMLQLQPDCHPSKVNPDQLYGDLLLNFLDLYGNKFNTTETGIIMEPPNYYDKVRYPRRRQNANNLTIIDPNNPDNDISGGSREVFACFEVFRHAHAQILQQMSKIHAGKDVGGSILGHVLGGNYTSFIEQRNRLHKLYNGEDVGPPPAPVANSQPKPQRSGKRKMNDANTDSQPNKHFRSDAPPAESLAGRVQNRLPAKPPASTRYVDLYVAPPSPSRLAEPPSDSRRPW